MADEWLEHLLETLNQIAHSLEGIEQELRLWRKAGLGPNGRWVSGEDVSHETSKTESEAALPEVLPSPEDLLRAWLSERNLVLQNVTLLKLEEDPWDWFARFLGGRFEHLRPFYERWKRALSLRKEFTLNLQDAPPRQISDAVQFALRLKEASLITDYQYHRLSRTLRVIPAFSSDIINFVTGGWLERYIGRLLWSMVGRVGLKSRQFQVFRNVQLVLPTHQQTELDLLALYGDQALWLESKTGDYSTSVERWKQNSTYLQLPSTHAGIVLLDTPSSTARQMLEQRTGMQVLSLSDLSAFLEAAMRAWVGDIHRV